MSPFFAARSVRSAAFCVLAALTASCTLTGGRSRVREGSLYVASNPTYDAYFRDVHALQASASHWVEARQASRKPLCDELKTSCDVPDATLAQLTHERMVEVSKVAGSLSLELVGEDAKMVASNGGKSVSPAARALFRAVEVTARAELSRARRMRTTSTKIDQVVRVGHDLEQRVTTDFTRQGAGKASEVRSELEASFDALAPHSSTTHGLAQGAEDFVLDLKRAIVTASGLPAAPPGRTKPPKDKEAPPPKVAPTPVVAAADASPPPPPPPSKKVPPPPPKSAPPAEEVFNP